MFKLLKNFFNDDDTIIGLCGFKGKLAPVHITVKSNSEFKNKQRFIENDNPFFKCDYKCNNFKIDLSDNILLF